MIGVTSCVEVPAKLQLYSYENEFHPGGTRKSTRDNISGQSANPFTSFWRKRNH